MDESGHSGARRGITLIESVIALFLFALFIAGACDVIVTMRQTGYRARVRYTAVNLAKNRLERVMAFTFSQVDQCAMNKLVVDDGGSPDPNGDYQLSTTVALVSPVLKKVTVHVDVRNHRTMQFDAEYQELVSYVTNYTTH